ncbi:MAG TPA: hypothetical protein EYP14_05490, partial [Planctomycetaceae bacterium]|nr:hypothetical protein [Planctomycetaceae bacterium]
PTPVDVIMLVGSFGLFFTLFLLFCRYLPTVAIAEVKTVLKEPGPMEADGRGAACGPKSDDGDTLALAGSAP